MNNELEVPFTYDIIDMRPFTETQTEPATVIKREHHEWLVRDLPITVTATNKPEWITVNSEDHVHIPLFPYICKNTDPATTIGFAFLLGFIAKSKAIATTNITQLHISLGYPVEVTSINNEDKFRFWMGFACKVD